MKLQIYNKYLHFTRDDHNPYTDSWRTMYISMLSGKLQFNDFFARTYEQIPIL